MRHAACARALDPTHTNLSRALTLNQTLHPVVVPDMLRCDFPWSAFWSMYLSVRFYMTLPKPREVKKSLGTKTRNNLEMFGDIRRLKTQR